jgi:nitrous oxidase accessory protein NosD
MSASVVIMLDTTAPLIEFGGVSVNSSLVMSLPYEINEVATISARLLTTGGEIIGTVLSDRLTFDLSVVGVAAVQMVVVDLMDEVLNERQVTQPLVLRDFTRVLSYAIFEQPMIDVDDRIEDPVLTFIPQSDPTINKEFLKD